MHRTIRGLAWARTAPAPAFAGKARPRGAKAQGLRYERHAQTHAQRYGQVTAGQWFQFYDANGPGYCQPDLLVSVPACGGLVIIECKLTWVREAHSQLAELYVPVVERALGRPVRGLVMCKHLAPGAPPASEDFHEALARGGVWHWLGPQGVSRGKRGRENVLALLQSW